MRFQVQKIDLKKRDEKGVIKKSRIDYCMVGRHLFPVVLKLVPFNSLTKVNDFGKIYFCKNVGFSTNSSQVDS